jgi:ERCC4-related helicase
LVEAYNSRRAFIQNAKSREEKCLKLAAENINRKVIVFCEYIESADLIYKALLELYGSEKIKRYYSATKKQTKESRWEVYQREKENREALDAFVYGNASVIVTVKSFNEGVDISSADVAIVYQNTVSVRDFSFGV